MPSGHTLANLKLIYLKKKKINGGLIFERNKEFREKYKSFFGTRNANQRFLYEETLCLLRSTHTLILVIC